MLKISIDIKDLFLWLMVVIVCGVLGGVIGNVAGNYGKAYMTEAKQKTPEKIYAPIGIWHITTYQARVEECDSTPNIGAFGRVAINGHPTGHWFACNVLPKGTQIIIPDLTGDIVWTCKDRMNRRYDYRANIDLLIPLNFTQFSKKAKVVIVKRVKEIL